MAEFLSKLDVLGGFGLILFLIIGFILILRLLGAWSLRINEIINLQKQILKEIKKEED